MITVRLRSEGTFVIDRDIDLTPEGNFPKFVTYDSRTFEVNLSNRREYNEVFTYDIPT